MANAVNDATKAAGERTHSRLRMLDGWRAISIVLVLAGHMLPLGPASWNMNGPIAANGMAIFFCLSGFLIVSILQRDGNVGVFLVRRLARILPLAWLVLAIALAVRGASTSVWLGNFLFYANLPPFYLDPWSSHYWSLDLEMQFYVLIAVAVLVGGRRALLAVPIAALIVTSLRVASGTQMSIVTWLRVDEILAGGTLALIIHGNPAGHAVRLLQRAPLSLALFLFFLSTRPELPVLNYMRPYLCAIMVGITIVRPVRWLTPMLESRPAAYVAQISYAVYIIHHFTLFGWLGSGHGLEKYAKRPFSFAITFVLAHLSTFKFERHFIEWSHRATRKPPKPARA